MAWGAVMKTLRESVSDYLVMRRSMGYKVEGLTKLLSSFVAYSEARGVERVQKEIALEWASSKMKVEVTDALIARRMDAVRIFARHQHALDPTTEIPDETVCNRRYQPKAPKVFTEAQISSLVVAALSLPPQFKAKTWQTLIGLLATTGMRPGEAVRLSIDDIDLNTKVIQVLDTKFGKSRLVFLHPSTATVLEQYLQIRADHFGAGPGSTSMVFLNSRGTALDANRLNSVFKEVLAIAGITNAPGRRPYRLHDLRHTFAVRTLLGWYQQGCDVQQRLPLLSTWLGHVDPASTYWYLHAVPELLSQVAELLEAQQNPSTERATS